jgi:magnesium transporter
MLVVRSRSGDGTWRGPDEASKVDGIRPAPGALLWGEADVSGASERDVRAIAREFDLDPLAVEDAAKARQRPKVEPYEAHLFLVLHQLDEVDDQLEEHQIGCFVGEGFLLVLHHGAGRTLDEVHRRFEEARSDVDDVDGVLHLLLDVAVDDYQAIADRLADDVEELEEKALVVSRAQETDAEAAVEMPSQYMLYSLKQQLSMLRRFALPLTGALGPELGHQHGALASAKTRRLFRDVLDHLIRIDAQVRNIEDLAGGVIDLTRAAQADMLNDVNRKLSAWAAIIAIPTFIASVYGTNYRLLPSPALGYYGFLMVVGLLLVSGFALYVFFKRKGWI